MLHRIIAFTGKKGSGKSTAADVLVSSFGYTNVAFADPLREICAIAFGLTHEEMTDPELKEKKLDRWPYQSPREILQRVGTDMFREHYPGVWINAWKRRQSEYPFVVTPDLRFPDEQQALNDFGGFVYAIKRPGLKSNDTHASENQPINPNEVIVNDHPTKAAFQTATYALFYDKWASMKPEKREMHTAAARQRSALRVGQAMKGRK